MPAEELDELTAGYDPLIEARDLSVADKRRLKGENQLPKVVRGVKFQNGVEVVETPAHNAA